MRCRSRIRRVVPRIRVVRDSRSRTRVTCCLLLEEKSLSSTTRISTNYDTILFVSMVVSKAAIARRRDSSVELWVHSVKCSVVQ